MKPVPSLAVLVLAWLLAACGGAAPDPAPDEVSATWTAGDDAPLEPDAPAEGAGPADAAGPTDAR